MIEFKKEREQPDIEFKSILKGWSAIKWGVEQMLTYMTDDSKWELIAQMYGPECYDVSRKLKKEGKSIDEAVYDYFLTEVKNEIKDFLKIDELSLSSKQ